MSNLLETNKAMAKLVEAISKSDDEALMVAFIVTAAKNLAYDIHASERYKAKEEDGKPSQGGSMVNWTQCADIILETFDERSLKPLLLNQGAVKRIIEDTPTPVEKAFNFIKNFPRHKDAKYFAMLILYIGGYYESYPYCAETSVDLLDDENKLLGYAILDDSINLFKACKSCVADLVNLFPELAKV